MSKRKTFYCRCRDISHQVTITINPFDEKESEKAFDEYYCEIAVGIVRPTSFWQRLKYLFGKEETCIVDVLLNKEDTNNLAKFLLDKRLTNPLNWFKI